MSNVAMDGVVALGKAKQLINSSITGIGSSKVVDNKLVITFNNGKTQTIIFPTPKDGVSVVDIDINDKNQIVFTMSDGTEIVSNSTIPVIKGDPFTYDDFTVEQLENLKGTDGISPTITITEATGRHTVSFTDKDGVKSFVIKDGSALDVENYYTKDEIDTALIGKANADTIPTVPVNVSELNNDENYIKNTVDNLVYYYNKADTYTKTEVNGLISNIQKLTSQIVDELPTENIDSSVIYLIRIGDTSAYMQHMYISGAWAELGSTQVDLFDYYKKTEIDTKLADKADKTEIPTVPTLISAFTNDKGYMTEFTETDPTVPAWAKEPQKPKYTAVEVGALPEDTDVPVFTNKTVLDGITSEKIKEWDTKSDFDGDYNSLINKPDTSNSEETKTHILTDIYGEEGVHGFRYYNNTLQVQNAEGDWFDVILGGGDSSNIHQLSFLNVRANDVKYLNLDVGNVFTKSLIQAYKFIPGQTNIVETLKSFNNADASNFNYNDENVEFTYNGMGIKDNYELTMSKYNDELYITESFNKNDFIDISIIE